MMWYVRGLVWLLLLRCEFCNRLNAQNFAFWQNSRSNVRLVSANPAMLHLKKEAWAGHIFSFDGNVVSNTGSISSKDLFHVNANFLRQNVLGTLKISTGTGTLSITGPSVAYGVTRKLSIALSTRTRFHSNYWKADGRLISEIGEIVKVPQEYPYFMKREEMQMVASTFSELGLSVSYLVMENNGHSLTGGITVSLINNVANTSISVPSLTASIRRINSYLTSLTEATGQVSTQTSGNFFSDPSLKNLISVRKPSLSSILGLTYEYAADQSEPYILRIGLSLNDLGYLRFRSDSAFSKSYGINIPGNKGLFFNNNFNNSAFSQTTKVFDKYPEFFRNTGIQAGSYSVMLPTSLYMTADFRLSKNIFIGSYGLLSLTRKNDIHTLRANSVALLAPRWEQRDWGVGASFGYQELGGLSSGISLKIGPVFFSSNTLLSSTFSRSKQMSLSAGIILPPSLLK